MPKVTTYAQRTRRIVVPFEEDDDEPLTIEYRPRAITPRMERAFQDLQASGQADQVIYDSLHALIESWDLTDDDGQSGRKHHDEDEEKVAETHGGLQGCDGPYNGRKTKDE